MRTLVTILVISLLMLVPVAGASAECPAVEGKAHLDFGKTLTGKAHLTYDGVAMKVDFTETGYVSTGPFTADVYFDWHFPQGTISIVEHSTITPMGGPVYAFESTIAVLSGGTGTWTWSGVANGNGGVANIKTIQGTLCIGS